MNRHRQMTFGAGVRIVIILRRLLGNRIGPNGPYDPRRFIPKCSPFLTLRVSTISPRC
jgi:hypothetical protein